MSKRYHSCGHEATFWDAILTDVCIDCAFGKNGKYRKEEKLEDIMNPPSLTIAGA